MAEVPQLVRERLRRQETAGEHPDANLLCAFAEHALTEQERAPVLDHLSRCAACREIVALSTPDVGEARLVAPAVASSSASVKLSWWRSPVLHWGALTAAALVVLFAVAGRMRLREGHSASAPVIAKYEAAQQPVAATEAAPLPPEPKPSPKPAAAPASPSRAIAAGASGRPASQDKYAVRKSVPAQASAQNAPAPKPPTDASESKAGTTAGPAKPVGRDQLKAAGPSAMVGGVVGGIVAAPAPKSEAAVLSQGRSAMLAKRASLGARWSISDSGALQRSFDGGRSWQEVAVADGVTFRAVATVGQELWAGGSGGALYHSVDGGEHWLQVRVQANGRVLSGDIVRIEFADAKKGLVSSSTGEIWATYDNGTTWRLQ